MGSKIIGIGGEAEVLAATEAVDAKIVLGTTATDSVATAVGNVETAIAALPAAPPALHMAIGTGEKVAESGKLYFIVWAGPGGGPEPRMQLADSGSTFFDTYSELKVCVVLAPAIPMPFTGNLTITSDARAVAIGYTLDSEE